MNYAMIVYIFGPIFYYSDILKNNFYYSIHNSNIHFYESLNKKKIIILYNSKKNNVFFSHIYWNNLFNLYVNINYYLNIKKK